MPAPSAPPPKAAAAPPTLTARLRGAVKRAAGSRLPALRRLASRLRAAPYVQTLPLPGSLGLNARLVLHPDDFYTHLRYRVPPRTVRVPVRIRENGAEQVARATEVDYRVGEVGVFDFAAIVAGVGLPPDRDYTLSLELNNDGGKPAVDLELAYRGETLWGTMIAVWRNFDRAAGRLLVINPKLRFSEDLDSATLICYPSTNPAMPAAARVKYLVAGLDGAIVVTGEVDVPRNGFAVLPPAAERAALRGEYTLKAAGPFPMATLTLFLDRRGRTVNLEHTQPPLKYSRGWLDTDLDIRRYWARKLAAL